MRVRAIRTWILALALALLAAAAAPADAATEARSCTTDDFAAVVDQTAQALRDLNSQGEQQFKAKLAELGRRMKWRRAERDARAASFLSDARIEGFNGEIETQFGRMDSLSNTESGKIDCARLDELKRVRDRLLTLMGQKSGYVLAKIELALAAAAEQARAKPVPPAPPTQKPESKPRTESARVEPQAPAPARPAPTQPTPDAPVPLRPATPQGQAPDVIPWASVPLPEGDQQSTFTIREIREAGKGVFGTVSAEIAGAINGVFQGLGRPNGYIVGDEGGGAILAGLRYGGGVLHLKDGRALPVYWQGPSLGFDFGAAGSNTMFLVYNLKDPNAIFGRFSGIDGSAYLAGGVGATLLIKGDMVLAPIRSGIGLRLGASLAYLKFTDRQTWNPF